MANPGIHRFEADVIYPRFSEARHVQYSKATFLNADSKVAGLVGVMVDLTDMKRAETDLRKNETQLRLALESAEMATWHWNVGDLAFHASGGFNSLFGLPRDVALKDFNDFKAAVHPRTASAWTQR